MKSLNTTKTTIDAKVDANGLLKPKRAYSVDVLRGVAILLMVLSNLEPFGNLPAWMYHAQTPPPTRAFNPAVAGITWVDLIFPFFIFSMGAAIPFAQTRKLRAGASILSLVKGILKRWGLLLGFAIYAAHIYPTSVTNDITKPIWLYGLAMYFLMFAIWGRFPWKMSKAVASSIKFAGVAVAAVVFGFMTFKDGRGFNLFRTNIILFVLADIALFGSLIWLFTRQNMTLRLGLMGILIAFRLSFGVEGSWIHAVGTNSEIPFLAGLVKSHVAQENLKYFSWIYNYHWFLQWTFLKYLFIIIPATCVGDMIQEWMDLPANDKERYGWSKARALQIVILMLAFVVVSLLGLFSRQIVPTTITLFAMCVFGFLFFRNPLNSEEKMLAKFYRWGCFWIVLGMIFEPYEGGIKKDPSTMSFYFMMDALAIFSIIGITLLLDRFGGKKWLSLFILNGQNPMIAYMSGPNVVIPLLALFGLRHKYLEFCNSNAWGGFALAVSLVLLVGIWVSLFTKKKIFLRT